MADSIVYLTYAGAGEDDFWFALATDGEKYEVALPDDMDDRRRASRLENINIKVEGALKDIEEGAPKPEHVGHVLFYNWTYIKNYVEKFDDYGKAVERARAIASDPPYVKDLEAQEES